MIGIISFIPVLMSWSKKVRNAWQKVLNRSKLIQMIKTFAIFNPFENGHDI